MKKLVIGLMFLGITNLVVAQSNQYVHGEYLAGEYLAEVTILSSNSTYMNNVLDVNTPAQIRNLEAEAARYDVTEHPKFNEEDFDSFEVIFEQPNARIIATYNDEGEIIKSYERFKDVILPKNLVKQIMMEYPGWEFRSDTYLVKYYLGKDVKKYYKLQLIKDNNKVNLKVDPTGNVL
ncbi:hypothetical protein ACFQ0I_09520 [Mariniflexile aquimaris]|uniref:Nicotinate-nucleotide adenylyltransferase n=1 Tax=Mariniflexile aquimaris TaxID=881009 RepID=A0ABW3BVB4_9FLAO